MLILFSNIAFLCTYWSFSYMYTTHTVHHESDIYVFQLPLYTVMYVAIYVLLCVVLW